MITETAYKKYFGVSTAPTNLDRLENIALEEIKSIMTCDIPTSTDDNYDKFLKALMEQINYFDLNDDLISYSQLGGASLGKFNEGSAISNTIAKTPRISPMAYKILLNLGYLYVGACVYE